MDAAALRAIAEHGLALVALVILSIVAYRWVVDQRTDLRKQRDTALAAWQTQTAATEKLADELRGLRELLLDRRQR